MAKRLPLTRNVYFDMAEAPLIADQSGESKTAILKSVADAIRRIGLERIVFGSDVSGPGHLEPSAAWTQFTRDVPLTDKEFEIVAANVAPYFNP
jgi:predicted TIM-barrel fold metal-dependent hydrolase